MKGRMKVAVGGALATAAIVAGTAAFATGGGKDGIQETLNGYEETPLALSTPGSGEFEAHVRASKEQISYSLSYANLEAPVTQAHIHFGAIGQSGGISVFLCSNLGNGPAGTQACPDAPATITGKIKPGDVIGPAAQGIDPGQFDELIDGIRAGATYANVHSTKYPGGEIRAQLEPQED